MEAMAKACSPRLKTQSLNIQYLGSMKCHKKMGRPYKLNVLAVHGVTHDLGDGQACQGFVERLLQGLRQGKAGLGGLHHQHLLFAIVFALKVRKCKVLANHKAKTYKLLGKGGGRLALGIEAYGNGQELDAQGLVLGLCQDIGNTYRQTTWAGKGCGSGLCLADTGRLKAF